MTHHKKTNKNKSKNNKKIGGETHIRKKTQKNISRYVPKLSVSLTNDFETEITRKFLEMLIMIKLYHWRTHSYATHKATDELYSLLNKHMDRFIEVLLGKTDSRMKFSGKQTFPLIDISSIDRLKNKIMSYKSYLADLENNSFIQKMSNNNLPLMLY